MLVAVLAERWEHLEALLIQRLAGTAPEERGEIFRRWLMVKYLGPIEEWLFG